jgi:hypothetical protein
MLSDWDRLPENTCNKLSVKLFTFYASGQLNRQEEKLIDAHCESCDDCRANLAYVYEIIKGREKLSLDQQTLLLKYLEDPLYKYTIEKLKEEIKEEILQELKASVLTEKSKNISKASIEELINKHFSKVVGLKSIKNSKTSSDNSNSEKKTTAKFFGVNLRYSYIVSAFLVTVLLGLTISTYLMLNSKPKEVLTISSTLPTSEPIAFPVIQKYKQQDKNLYQELDSFIDKYLEYKQIEYLEQAQNIAKDIEGKYQDNYGVDLVAYYKTVPSSSMEKLLSLRKQLSGLTNKFQGDNYENSLKESELLEENFLASGDFIELYRAKTISSKFYTLLHNYKLSKITIEKGLEFSRYNNYLFLQGYFLLWQAKALSDNTSFEESEPIFQKAVLIGERLHLDDLIASAGVSLVSLYHINNYDQKSLELAQTLIKLKTIKKERLISILHIAGVSAFNLKYYDLSNSYLTESTKLSEEINNPACLARTYMFLSVIQAEKGNFADSDIYHSKAINSAYKLSDKFTVLDTLSIISGYYAKAKLLQGDFASASKAYKETLNMMSELKLNNNLELSQLNEGLATALKALKNNKESQEYFAVASHYQKLAEGNKEKTNCLLSFIPSKCVLP